LTQEVGHEPSLSKLAEALDIPTSTAEQILNAVQVPLSLEMPINEGDGELGDLIEDEATPTPDEDVAFMALQQLIRDILQDLPPREMRILQLRYGLVDGETHTLEEVGKKLGVTRERVRQIEAQALRRLRHPKWLRRLRDFLPTW
jgi:RNA polymerase primary sigma factor